MVGVSGAKSGGVSRFMVPGRAIINAGILNRTTPLLGGVKGGTFVMANERVTISCVVGRLATLLSRGNVSYIVFSNVANRPASAVVRGNIRVLGSSNYSFVVNVNKNDPLSSTGTVTTVTIGRNDVTSCGKGGVANRVLPLTTVPAATKANDRTAGFAMVASSRGKVGVLLGNSILIPGLTVISDDFAINTPGSIASTANLSTLARTIRTCASEGTFSVASALTISTIGEVVGCLPVTCERPSGSLTERRVDVTTLRTNVYVGGSDMAVIRKVDEPVNTLFRIPRKVSGTVLLGRYLDFTMSNTCRGFTGLNERANITDSSSDSRATTRGFVSSLRGVYSIYRVPALRRCKVSESRCCSGVSGVTASTITDKDPTGAMGRIAISSYVRVCGGLCI